MLRSALPALRVSLPACAQMRGGGRGWAWSGGLGLGHRAGWGSWRWGDGEGDRRMGGWEDGINALGLAFERRMLMDAC